MVQVDKLRGKMAERRLSGGEVAEKMGIHRTTFYRKLGDGGDTFFMWEVESLVKILGLTNTEVLEIFFDKKVA